MPPILYIFKWPKYCNNNVKALRILYTLRYPNSFITVRISGGHDLTRAAYRLCHRLYTDNTLVNKPWRYKQSVVGDTREVSRFKIPERSTSTSGLINKTRINPYFVFTSRGTTLNLLPFAVSILLGDLSIVVVIRIKKNQLPTSEWGCFLVLNIKDLHKFIDTLSFKIVHWSKIYILYLIT